MTFKYKNTKKFGTIKRKPYICNIIKKEKTMPKIFEYFGLSEKDAATAEAFVRKYYKNIVEKWVNFFIYKKRVRSTKITKKL